MEFRYNEYYYKGIRHLFYEIGKAKTEIDFKIIKLTTLAQQPEYKNIQASISTELLDIAKQIDTLDQNIRFNVTVDFEETTNNLLKHKMRLIKCEQQLFEALIISCEKNTCKCCHHK